MDVHVAVLTCVNPYREYLPPALSPPPGPRHLGRENTNDPAMTVDMGDRQL